jgi:hypothetical protein
MSKVKKLWQFDSTFAAIFDIHSTLCNYYISDCACWIQYRCVFNSVIFTFGHTHSFLVFCVSYELHSMLVGRRGDPVSRHLHLHYSTVEVSLEACSVQYVTHLKFSSPQH